VYAIALMTKDDYQEVVFRNRRHFEQKRKKYDIRKIECAEAVSDLVQDQVVKYEKIIEELKERNIREIQDIIDNQLEITASFLKEDIDALMFAKQKYLTRISYYADDLQIEKLEAFVLELKEKIKNAIAKKAEYDDFYWCVSEDFKPYADKLFKYPSLFNSLVSAEFLYNRFIVTKPEQRGFDYSCVSIMYYMSLEEFINKILYVPYKNKILVQNRDKIFDTKRYLSKPGYYMRGNDIKSSCELGPLAYLFKNITETQAFEAFVRKEFGIIDSDIVEIQKFGQKLLEKVMNRNDAAHGGHNISYETANEDKIIVYPEDDIDNTRGLLKEFLKLFLGK